jgi:hypothetical protein
MEEAATPASEAIHGVLKAASVRDRALLVLFALEGLTVHEVEALRRADVHLNESPRMHVRCGGRGEAPRDLALDPYVAKCLAERTRRSRLSWGPGQASHSAADAANMSKPLRRRRGPTENAQRPSEWLDPGEAGPRNATRKDSRAPWAKEPELCAERRLEFSSAAVPAR